MARWAPQKHDVLDAFATEIASVYPRRVIVAIMADDAAESAAFGDDLAVALESAGRHAVVSDTFDAAPDVVTIVVGPEARDEANLQRSNVPVWLDHDRDDDRRLRRTIGVVFDVSDPEHPRRRFADSC